MTLIVALLAVLLVAVCSLQEAGDGDRTPGEILAAARRTGLIRSAAKALVAVLVVVLLIATAFPLSLATQLANAGGLR